jgi:hypothetical protein
MKSKIKLNDAAFTQNAKKNLLAEVWQSPVLEVISWVETAQTGINSPGDKGMNMMSS